MVADIGIILSVGRKEMKKNRNSNFMKVSVKTDRYCCHCSDKILKGNECITLNKYGKGRRWLCLKCYSLAKNVVELNSICKGISFDDEGASYYFEGELEAARIGFECRRKNNE